MNEDFNQYMQFFKQQTLKEKQSIIIEQMKTLLGFTNTICDELGANTDIILNKELVDINKENYTEDDFAEAVIVLVNSVQNSLCDATNALADIVDKI